MIAVVDSDADPFGVLYPIPGNDDSTASIHLYKSLFYNAIADATKNEILRVLGDKQTSCLIV